MPDLQMSIANVTVSLDPEIHCDVASKLCQNFLLSFLLGILLLGPS